MLFLLASNFPSGSDVDAFKDLISDFSEWIERIGLIVALAGAIKFAIAIKDDDAKDKTLALLTMVSGFLIAEIADATSTNYYLFSIPKDAAAVTTYWNSIIPFIRKWIRRIGRFIMFIGATEFAFAFKSNDAGLKITALKSIATGAIIVACAMAFL
jgi:hypothetical protein